MELNKLTIKEARKGLQNGDFSVKELTEACFDKKKNKELNAYIEIFDDPERRIEAIGEDVKNKEGGILSGIPIAIKDNLLFKGHKVSAGSKILENYTAVYDATVIKKLEEAGAVITGRTNMDEFAMGSSTESSAYGICKNPHDQTRVSGGSSGGSAVAVASGMALGSLGSDTGGSIRQPASFCGIVGLKPTYGAVSRYGVIALGSSLDQIGAFGKTVEDVEIIFNVIKGHDKMDSTSIPDDLRYSGETKEKLTIGVPKDFIEVEGIDKDVLENFNNTLASLEKMGHNIKEITLPNVKYSLPAYYIIMPAEASSNLSRFDGIRYGLSVSGDNLLEDYLKTKGEGFGKEVRRRIILGTYVLSAGYYDAYYNKALAVRKIISKEFDDKFKDVDVIVTPTTPTPAFKIGEKTKDPVSMYFADIFTVPANITGIPAISIPSGFVERDGKSLPLGLHIMAPHFREDLLFKLGKDFEKSK